MLEAVLVLVVAKGSLNVSPNIFPYSPVLPSTDLETTVETPLRHEVIKVVEGFDRLGAVGVLGSFHTIHYLSVVLLPVRDGIGSATDLRS